MNKSIKYIGVDDTDIKLFENQYPVPDGVSYNSYMVIGDKTAVLDAVDARYIHQWTDRIRQELPAGKSVDYLVVHHMEPDHSAGIGCLMNLYPEMKIVASQKAIDMMPHFFHETEFGGRTIAISEGDELSLGNGHTLRFYTAPMVHWPEVAVSYHVEQRILFSADAFGKFGALQHDGAEWCDEARRYYINIVGKYGQQVRSLLKKASTLPIETIAPLHGPILTASLEQYVKLYDTWSSYIPETNGVLVAYASVYGGTADAALLLADKLRSKGVTVTTADLCRDDISEAVAQAFRMSALVCASITYDASILPAMRDFLQRLAAKGYRSRHVAFIQNGSWAPVAAKIMRDIVETMRDITFVEPVVTIRSRMSEPEKSALDELAGALRSACVQEK